MFNWDSSYIPNEKEHWIKNKKLIKELIKEKSILFDKFISVNPYEIKKVNHKNKLSYNSY